MREDIRNLQRQLGITTVFVTHDQEEALSISDRIVVMHEGRADQVGRPFEIYNFPQTRFVASFVGTLNILKARVLDPVAGRIEIDGQTVGAAGGASGLSAGSECTVALRPEALKVGEPGPDRNRLAGTVEDVHFLGAVVRVRVRLGESAVSLDMFNNPGSPPPERGQPVTLGFGREDILVLKDPPPAA